MSSNKADQSPEPESRPRVLVLGGGLVGKFGGSISVIGPDFKPVAFSTSRAVPSNGRWAWPSTRRTTPGHQLLQQRGISSLTIVATVFLPLSFLTGYFGMNFRILIADAQSTLWQSWAKLHAARNARTTAISSQLLS
jgi:hypothetical protein